MHHTRSIHQIHPSLHHIPAVARNPAYAEEVFGPVLGIVEAATLEEAIAFVNRR